MVVHELHDAKQDRSQGEDMKQVMQTDKEQWDHIQDTEERRRVQNVLAQRRYRM
jgi:hypothetical protein